MEPHRKILTDQQGPTSPGDTHQLFVSHTNPVTAPCCPGPQYTPVSHTSRKQYGHSALPSFLGSVSRALGLSPSGPAAPGEPYRLVRGCLTWRREGGSSNADRVGGRSLGLWDSEEPLSAGDARQVGCSGLGPLWELTALPLPAHPEVCNQPRRENLHRGNRPTLDIRYGRPSLKRAGELLTRHRA